MLEKQGESKHCISRWVRFYGTDWIPERVWWLLRIRGLK